MATQDDFSQVKRYAPNNGQASANDDILEAPSEVSVIDNMKQARSFLVLTSITYKLWWFYKQVKAGGPWDYKNLKEYKGKGDFENFGNFHYGAVGIAAEIPELTLLRLAGAAQMGDGSYSETFGRPWLYPPYGDDPKDHHYVKQGIIYAYNNGYSTSANFISRGNTLLIENATNKMIYYLIPQKYREEMGKDKPHWYLSLLNDQTVRNIT